MDHRRNEGLVRALHHSGVAVMASRYSKTPEVSLDDHVQAIKS